MNAWLQLLPKLKPGAQVTIRYNNGGQITDHICNDEAAFGPHYFTCAHNGTYSLRNGWHVLGERRIIDVIEAPSPKPAHVASAREKIIAGLARKHAVVHT